MPHFKFSLMNNPISVAPFDLYGVWLNPLYTHRQIYQTIIGLTITVWISNFYTLENIVKRNLRIITDLKIVDTQNDLCAYAKYDPATNLMFVRFLWNGRNYQIF